MAYVLVLVHPLALAANGLSKSLAFAWQTLSPFDEGWAVWSGWVGLLVLMLGLAATFSRSLRYGTWRWLHAGLGVGVLIGLSHLVLLGIDEPVLPIIAVAALILAWRGLRGDWGWRRGLTLSPRCAGSPKVPSKCAASARRPAGGRGGAGRAGGLLRRTDLSRLGELHPFTASSIDGDHVLHIGVKALGDCTRRMLSIETGVAARVLGGFGNFLAERPAAPQLWVAGGIGVTPFIGLLRAGHLPRPDDVALPLPQGRAKPLLLLSCARSRSPIHDCRC